MTTIAVMQPYFLPYAGYFRLFVAADAVVMFDCVQFPRRGWVHRNRFPLSNGDLDWLTLPIAKADRTARISELRFPNDVRPRVERMLRRFPLLERAHASGDPLVQRMLDFSSDVAAYLSGLVRDIAESLQISRPTIRSSTLGIDPSLRAQERVLAIVEALGGTRYVNPPGGRHLYDRSTFANRGIELRFLTPYRGSTDSILARLLTEPRETIAEEIRHQTILVD